MITASATVPVFGELITDPIKTVQQIDTPFAILLGGLTFVTATVGINIVANFISPAFDFSNVNPQKISWRTGGMIAAVGSVILTPWNWYDNDEAIHYTLGILGSLIGPLFGILIAGYYLAARQRIAVDAALLERARPMITCRPPTKRTSRTERRPHSRSTSLACPTSSSNTISR